MRLHQPFALSSLIAATLTLGCSFDPGPPGSAGGGGSGGYTPPVGGSGGIVIPADGGLPIDFVPAEIGGYKLGDPITSGTTGGVPSGPTGCALIVGSVRDFKGANVSGGHPDFEAYEGDDATTGLVAPTLGTDMKPVYASQCEAGVAVGGACPYGPQTTSEADFDQWYHNVDGVNRPYLIYFQFVPNNGVMTFQSDAFFPLDGAGWGNSGTGEDGASHNYHFTTELHTTFRYQGGERFTFTGDDDLWVFINGRLAMDLGGLHAEVTDTIDLDQMAASLGITQGQEYPLDLFHAERHTVASNFRVDTNFVFVDCGTIVP